MPNLRLPPTLAAALAAVVLASASVMLAPESALPPFDPLDAQVAYEPTGDVAQAMIEPALHAPWRGSRPPALAWLLAVAVVIAAVGLGRACGASTPAAWIAAGALLLSAPFAASVRHGADAVLSVLLVWGAWWILIHARNGGRWLGASALMWASAIQFSWLAVATLPVMLLACMARHTAPRARFLVLLGVLALAAGGTMAYLNRAAASAQPPAAYGDTALGWRDVVRMTWGHPVGFADGGFAAPDVSGAVTLWMVLAAAALVFADWPRWWRMGLVLSAAAFGVIWLEWGSWKVDLLRSVGWTAAPLAGVGLTWAASQAGLRWRGLTLGALGAVLFGASLSAAVRPLGGREPRLFRDRFEAAVEAMIDVGARVAFVAEGSLVDSAIAAWAVAPRLAQNPEVLARAEAQGLVPLAGPVAREHLELVGLQFTTAARIVDPAPYHLSRVTQRFHCATVRADRWSLLPGVEYTGRLGMEMPPKLGGRLALIVGDDLPLQLRAALPNGSAVRLEEEALLSGPGADAPPPDYWFDTGDPRDAPQHVKRIRIPAHPTASSIISLYLGRRAPRVLARLERYDAAARGRICAAPLGPDAFWGDESSSVVRVPLNVGALFGSGWYGVEGGGSEAFRWTGADAAVLISSAREGSVRVALDAAPAAELVEGGPTLTLRVNGLAEPAHVMTAGTSRYEWRVQATRWLSGTNELLFSVSRSVRPADRGGHDTRVLGLRVRGLTLTRQ